jgi:pimeloyl-ACP methyl ester carboxylesterase
VQLTDRFAWQGREIAWGRAGHGPSVVFCHGTPFSSLLWQPFADSLSRDFTVHLWDMPGYGRSSKLAEHDVGFGTQSAALAALLDHWGLDRPHVVAHDFGGAVSLRTHLVHGVAYSSLMLVDVVAVPPVGSPFFRFVQAHPDVLGELPAPVHDAIVRTYVQGASARTLDAEALEALTRPWTGDVGQPAFYRQIAHFDERFLTEIEGLLGGIDIPVRILWGTDDEWISPGVGERLRRAIPGATLSLVDGAGHLVQHDAPAALADELRAWLDRRTGGMPGARADLPVT